MTQIPEVATALLAAGTAGSLATVPMLLSARRRAAGARRDAEAARLDAVGARLEAGAAQADREQALVELQAEVDRFQALTAENRHLAEVRVPSLIQSLTYRHIPLPGPLEPEFAGSGPAADHDAVLAGIARALADARRQVDAAAAAVMRGATSSLQALGYRQQSVVSSLQLKVDDPQLAEELFALDRLNEQSLRRIQATGVLCGAWPGLNREDSHLPDILAGAQGRVEDSKRITLTNQLRRPVGAVGRVVEPLAVVVAELMANAVYYSHGTLSVRVGLHHAAQGVCVVVDDAGIGMHDDDIAFAERMMNPEHESRLSELGDPPRAGFATIGRLSREYGFSVSVRGASPYGGVHAVVLIPQHLLVLMDESQPMSAMAPLPARGVEPVHGHAPAVADGWLPGQAAEAPVYERVYESADEQADARPEPRTPAIPAGPAGPYPAAIPAASDMPALPQRRRHRHRAGAPEPVPAPEPNTPTSQGDQPGQDPNHPAAPAAPTPAPTLGQTASVWSAVQSGTDQGREAAPAFRERNDS